MLETPASEEAEMERLARALEQIQSEDPFFFFLPSSSSVIGFRRLSLANEIRPAELYCPEGHFFSFNC